MLTDEELFEDNIMPKLQAEFKYAKDHGETNYEFALERMREFLKEGGGFGIKGWDDKQIRDKLLPYLVKKGLIAEVSHGRYRLTELGRSWQKSART
jgi:hypothetical protein